MNLYFRRELIELSLNFIMGVLIVLIASTLIALLLAPLV